MINEGWKRVEMKSLQVINNPCLMTKRGNRFLKTFQYFYTRWKRVRNFHCRKKLFTVKHPTLFHYSFISNLLSADYWVNYLISFETFFSFCWVSKSFTFVPQREKKKEKSNDKLRRKFNLLIIMISLQFSIHELP